MFQNYSLTGRERGQHLPDLFEKSLWIFFPFVYGELQNMSAENMSTNQNWSRGEVTKRTTEQVKNYYQRISQSNCFLFLLLEGDYVVLPYWCCGYLLFVIEKRRLCLLFSQVKLQNPIMYERASLAAFLGVSFDRLINTFYVALNTENATHIIHKIRRENGKFSPPCVK